MSCKADGFELSKATFNTTCDTFRHAKVSQQQLTCHSGPSSSFHVLPEITAMRLGAVAKPPITRCALSVQHVGLLLWSCYPFGI